MAIAFFDLDKTLIAENSAKLWLRDQWKNNNIKLHQMVMASYWLAKYHLGFTKLDEALEKGLAFVEGEKQSLVLKHTQQFFHSTIKKIYRPGALLALQKHRDLGHATSLLTSCFDGLSLLVQQDLGIDYCLSTRLEVDKNGIYTGNTAGQPCFGKNKITFAKKLCKDLKVPFNKCTFYTDSASDIPMLELVGQAVAVNPDPHLRARAQMKSWPIVDWGKPEM